MVLWFYRHKGDVSAAIRSGHSCGPELLGRGFCVAISPAFGPLKFGFQGRLANP
jgi:hypothetical protein